MLCQHRLIRMIFFHANVTLPKTMRLNHGVAIRFERREDVPDVGGGDAAAAATDPSSPLSPEDARFVAAFGLAGAPDTDPAEALLTAVAAWRRGSRGNRRDDAGGGPGAVPRPEPPVGIPDEGGEGHGPQFADDDLAFLGQEEDAGHVAEPGAEAAPVTEGETHAGNDDGAVRSEETPLEDPTRRAVQALADALGMESGLTPEVDQQIREQSAFREAYPADLDRPRGPEDEQDLDEIERRLREALQSHEAET